MRRIFLLADLCLAFGLTAPRILFAESGLIFDQTQGTLTGQLNVTSNIVAAGSVTALSATLTNTAGAGLTVSSSAYLAVSGGNVGIGTAAPGTKLQVAGTDNTSALLLSFPSGNTNNTYTGITFSGETPKAGILFASNAAGYARGSLIFAASNTNDYTGINLSHERMRITDSGNVGIGTTGPTGRLNVVSASITDTNAFRVDTAGGANSVFVSTNGNVGVGTATPGYKLHIGGVVGDYLVKIQQGASWGSGIEILTADIASVNSIYAHSSQTGSDFVVKANGNVGIGTTAPGEKLDVLGFLKARNSNADQFLARPDSNGLGFSEAYLSGQSMALALFANPQASNQTGTGSLTYALQSAGLISNSGTPLVLGAGGSEKMRISAAGNVGIGTTSPQYKLDVNGEIRSNLAAYTPVLSNEGNSGGLEIRSLNKMIFGNGGYFLQNTPNSYDVALFTGSTPAQRMTWSAAGNVGIGTTNPGAKLDIAGANIVGTSQGGGNLFVRSTDSYAADKGGMLSLGGNSNLPGGTVVPFASIAGRKTNGTAEHPSGYFAISTFKADYGHLERLRIDSDGNVGIGTTAPDFSLAIQNTTNNVFGYHRSDGGLQHGMYYGDYNGNTSPYAMNYRSFIGAGPAVTQPAFVFYTDNYGGSGGTVGTALSILSNGNVGIGATGPNAKLRVVGESNTIVFPIRIAKGNYADTGGHTSLMGFGVENAAWSKGAIGYTRTGSYDTGYMGFYLNSAANTTDVSTSDVKMTINNTGNVGIGSVSPVSLLELKSAAPILTINGTDNAQFKGINFATNGSVQANILSNIQAGELKIQSGTSGFGGFITFNLDGSEKVRIQATTGNVGIGTASPGSKLHVEGTTYSHASSGWGGEFLSAATDSSGGGLTATSGNCQTIIAWGNGGGMNWTNCAGGFTSDARLKKDINPITNGLNTIMALKPVTFRWREEKRNPGLITDKNKKAVRYGFIAQDVMKVLPDLVGEGPMKLTTLESGTETSAAKPGSEEMRYYLDYEGIISPLVSAVQELKADNDKLRKEFEAYKVAHP